MRKVNEGRRDGRCFKLDDDIARGRVHELARMLNSDASKTTATVIKGNSKAPGTKSLNKQCRWADRDVQQLR